MTMAASTTMLSINFSLCPFNQPLQTSHCTVNFLPFRKKISLNLTSSHSISGFAPILRHSVFTVASPTQNPQPLTIVSAKGYKMKTHKASAKRFRVTGSGKIMRRRAGKQHLLAKKNTKRKLRLSKMRPSGPILGASELVASTSPPVMRTCIRPPLEKDRTSAAFSGYVTG